MNRDGRDKPGHDEKRIGFAIVMPGLVPGIHVFLAARL
jgi:hypothetical protein